MNFPFKFDETIIKETIFSGIPCFFGIDFFTNKKRALYQGLKDDCFNHGIWIYDRIYNNEKPIDIAFLGSSRTVNGINDHLMEEKYAQQKLNVVNFGYCRLGMNLNYILLKEIVKAKKIKTIVLEVRQDEDRYSHLIFPYIADSKDVLFPNLLFNRDFISDYYNHFSYKLKILRNSIFNATTNKEIKTEDFGFASHPDTALLLSLNQIKEKRAVHRTELTEMERNFYMKFPRAYLKKIAEIYEQNNIQMFFLYLPEYGSLVYKPKE